MKKVFSFLAIAATILFAMSCEKEGGKNNHHNNGSAEDLPITIDGDFADWAKLDPTKVVSAKNNPDSPWDAVKEIKVYAADDFVFYYIKFDSAVLTDLLKEEAETLPIRLCLNTDGEFTSGYDQYFTRAYDTIIEGALAEEKAWTAYDGTLHLRYYNEEKAKNDWKELLKPGNNLVMGMGAGNEYEILLSREIFNNAVPEEHKMGDTFQTAIRFYTTATGWDELSNVPNTSVDKNDRCWGDLLDVTFDK